MSQKLDELRKRLLQQEQQSEQNQHDDQQPRVLNYSNRHEAVPSASAREQITAAPPASESVPQPEPQIPPPVMPRQAREAATPIVAGDRQLSEAVAKVFEQTEAFQDRLKELCAMFEPIERVGKAVANSFGPLSAFHDQLAQLARSFEPMKAFQVQLAVMAKTFEPMEALQEQLSQIADSFQLEIAQLANALEPAKLFREKIVDLAKAFDPVGELDEGFRALSDSFQSSANDDKIRLSVEPHTAQTVLPN